MANIDYNKDNILSNFPTCLQKNFEELCLKSKIGLSDVTLNDISLIPSRIINEENMPEHFHFIIKVPFAGKRLKWELFFDPEDYGYPPDFIFNDDNFLENPEHETINNNIPSLVNWNLKNPNNLSQVLNEFLLLYKNMQIEKLKQENIYSHYFEEYETLINGDNAIESENIEVQVEANSIHFLISIKIDCSALPKYIQPMLFRDNDCHAWFNPGEDFVHLKISIMKLDGSRTHVSLCLSPRLEQILGGFKTIHIPDYKRESSLSKYVSSVSTILENRFAFIVEHYKMKKVFITVLAATCSPSIIEYDTESFNKLVFLHTVQDYTCLITVIIGLKFPQEKPTVTLSSIYCQEGRKCIQNLERYPYDMHNNPEENIEMLFDSLEDTVLLFKNHNH